MKTITDNELIKQAKRAYQREYRKKNRERLNEYQREYMKKYRNTDKGKEVINRYWLNKAKKLQDSI